MRISRPTSHRIRLLVELAEKSVDTDQSELDAAGNIDRLTNVQQHTVEAEASHRKQDDCTSMPR
eukprot:8430271-Pyramimonas_sp.AAC.1